MVFIWSVCSGHLANAGPMFTYLGGKICGASLISLLLSLFTCLPFGVVREVREHLEETLIRDMKLDQNGKAVGCKTKTMS